MTSVRAQIPNHTEYGEDVQNMCQLRVTFYMEFRHGRKSDVRHKGDDDACLRAQRSMRTLGKYFFFSFDAQRPLYYISIFFFFHASSFTMH